MIEQELIKCIEQLNKTAQEDWGDRFKIELISNNGNKTRRNVELKMTDNKLNITQEDYSKFTKLGNRYIDFDIWNAFNRFVNMCLDKEFEKQ